MMEVNEIASLVEEQADKDAILIFGASVNEDMNNEIEITVIATGFGDGKGDDELTPINYSHLDESRPKKIITEDGLEGTEVTLEEIFKETRDEDISDSKFDIPTFLNNK